VKVDFSTKSLLDTALYSTLAKMGFGKSNSLWLRISISGFHYVVGVALISVLIIFGSRGESTYFYKRFSSTFLTSSRFITLMN